MDKLMGQQEVKRAQVFGAVERELNQPTRGVEATEYHYQPNAPPDQTLSDGGLRSVD